MKLCVKMAVNYLRAHFNFLSLNECFNFTSCDFSEPLYKVCLGLDFLLHVFANDMVLDRKLLHGVPCFIIPYKQPLLLMT